MKRAFTTTVKFDITNESVINTVKANLNIDKLGKDGSYKVFYNGNIKSGIGYEESVIKGTRNFLNRIGFKRGSYEIIKVEEI